VFTKALAKEGGDGSFVLDAEVVAWDTEKKVLLPFQVLSTRKRKADETEEQKVRIIVQGFDLLYLHGKSLLRQPLIVRRRNMYDAFQEVEGKFTFAKAKDVDLRDAADKKRDAQQKKAAAASDADADADADAGSSSSSSSSSSAMEEDVAADGGAAASSSSSSSSSKGGGGEGAGGDEEDAAESAEDGEQMIAAFMNDAVDGSCEGLMVKTLYGASATYEPSVRSLNWLKLKKDYMDGMEGVPDSLDLVPIGAYAGKGKRTGVWGAYLLAVYDGDSEEFQSVCKIGTGFSDVALKELSEQFEEHRYPEGCARPRMYQLGDSLEPDVYFKPVKVWEVRAADLSLSSTHKGGS
jgi:ATP-dependent DNA ligase